MRKNQHMLKPNALLRITILSILVLLVSATRCQEVYNPEEDLGSLFIYVQENEDIFPDSKTFVDCTPRYPVEQILHAWDGLSSRKRDDKIMGFLDDYFLIPGVSASYTSDSSSINEHIYHLWTYLQRPPDFEFKSSLIPLPYPYIVPGGRFREIYYWDSYFTMLGLLADGKQELMRNMVDNFAHLINTYGHIPNGNRSYYLSRSQPPFYVLMVNLLAELDGEEVFLKYRESLEKEYDFWMTGEDKLSEEFPAYRRLVRLGEKNYLNRYWDDKATPRPESYREDVATAEQAVQLGSIKDINLAYRHLRAAAESGWDFSSRWIKPEANGDYPLHNIHTTDIIPVDLNALLFQLELSLARACFLDGDKLQAEKYETRALVRKQALIRYCWNEEQGFFMDYDFIAGANTPVLSLAGVVPLFLKIASPEQAQEVAVHIEEDFLTPGGVVTTRNTTGQQWDAPNGWAPLQWMCIQGLRNYGYPELAEEIKIGWMELVEKEYEQSFKLLEKYNVVDINIPGGGGEYPNQDGFGWTNGVYQFLSKENNSAQ